MTQTKLTDIQPKKEEKTKAEEFAKELRSVSVSEFFEKNRHLLGYDNPTKALLTVVKEAVDNATDATEEARILPDILVKIERLTENRFRVTIEDNGPGIVKQHIPSVFASLLYGSKFHRLRQSRGIQGLGISSAVLYSQLTTGKSAKIISKISPKKPANYYELHINTLKNEPEIIKETEVSWQKDQGTKIELELEANYQKGSRSVDNYLKQVTIVNPHVTITYINPENQKIIFSRATTELPIEPKQIKPHPYGIELGILIRMLKSSKYKKLKSFLTNEFSRISSSIADEILKKSNLEANAQSSRIARQEAENLLKVIKETKIRAPPLDCLSPIGSELLQKSLKKELNVDFCEAVTRSPSVYRGFPFQIECLIAYGGSLESDKPVQLLRFANKVPLLYQQSACTITKAVISTKWNSYGLSQSKSSLPTGPALILVHIASVWVPFTSESKEAIAHYPEILKEIKLALQECGRKLGIFIRRNKKVAQEQKKKEYITIFIPHILTGLREILNLKQPQENKIEKNLKEILEKSRQ